MTPAGITVSIVSHRHNRLVNLLLADLAERCTGPITILVTENVPDSQPVAMPRSRHRLELIRNEVAKGYGANQNAAFRRCTSPYFCVSNPDVRLTGNPFPSLLQCLTEGAAAVGPLVRSPTGAAEDSARRFPTLGRLARKLFATPAGPDYPYDRGPVSVDWVAGMFMLFDASAYRDIKGFDEGYFLYYEDVDICRRLWRSARKVVYDPNVEIVHDARRGSRRNVRLALHHVRSALRFFLTD